MCSDIISNMTWFLWGGGDPRAPPSVSHPGWYTVYIHILSLSVRPSVQPSVHPSVRPIVCLSILVSYMLSLLHANFIKFKLIQLTQLLLPFHFIALMERVRTMPLLLHENLIVISTSTRKVSYHIPTHRI